jgi:hypothetical protein
MGFTREQIFREFAQVFDRFGFEGRASKAPMLAVEETHIEVEVAS